MNNWKKAAERIYNHNFPPDAQKGPVDQEFREMQIKEYIDILTTCAPAVSGEVVGALQIINDAHTMSKKDMATKYDLSGDIDTTNWAWVKVDEALSHAGECRCDCEKVMHEEEWNCLKCEADQTTNFNEEEFIRLLEVGETKVVKCTECSAHHELNIEEIHIGKLYIPDAALGAEEEKK